MDQTCFILDPTLYLPEKYEGLHFDDLLMNKALSKTYKNHEGLTNASGTFKLYCFIYTTPVSKFFDFHSTSSVYTFEIRNN